MAKYPDNIEQILQMDFSNEPMDVIGKKPMPLPEQGQLPDFLMDEPSGPEMLSAEEASTPNMRIDDRRASFEELLNKFRQSNSSKPDVAQAQGELEQMKQQASAPDDLAAARAERDKMRRMALMAQGFDDINKAGARYAGAELKPDTGISDYLNKKGDQGVSDVVDDRAQAQAQKQQALVMQDLKQKLENNKLDFQDKTAMRDPNSPQSQFVQDEYIRMNKVMGQPVDENTVRTQTSEALYKVSPWMQKVYSDKVKADLEKQQAQMNERRLSQADSRLANEERRMGQVDEQEVRRIGSFEKSYRDKLLSDPRFKDLAKQEQAFQQIPNLRKAAEDGNQVAVSAIGSRMARAMGEVGVLTDTDVVRYLGNQSYGRKMLDWYSRGMKGELPAATGQEIGEVADIMQNLVDKQVIPIYSEYASSMVSTHPRSIDEATALKKLGAPGFVSPSLDKLQEKATKKDSPDKKDTKSTKFEIKATEVPMKVNGKNAIFNKDTKEFIRWAE